MLRSAIEAGVVHHVLPVEEMPAKLLARARQMIQGSQLTASEQRFRDLYDNAPIAYFSVGVDGRIMQCNRTASGLLGHAVEELVGRPVLDLYAGTPDGKPKAVKVLGRFRRGDTVRNEELQMRRADGTPVWGSRLPASTSPTSSSATSAFRTWTATVWPGCCAPTPNLACGRSSSSRSAATRCRRTS